MRVLTVIPLSAAVGAMVALLPAGLLKPQKGTEERPLPAGDAPAFLFASVQPIKAPEAWRAIYHEVERCAGMLGDYDQIRWAVMDAPLKGPKGPTFGFTVGERIVLVRNDTTYLRHEMLHHVLLTAGWRPQWSPTSRSVPLSAP